MLKNRLSCILLPKMSAYGSDFNKNKCISFLIKYEKLLEKYTEIWKKGQQHYRVNLYAVKQCMQ